MPLHIDLIERGYFPVEIPPVFSTSSLASASGYLPTNLDSFAAKSSRCAFHSIPRLLHHRRLLGIPNPLHQSKLVVILEKHWTDLEANMNKSALSMTRLRYAYGSERGLDREYDFDALEPSELCAKSFILQVYDVLARHRPAPSLCGGSVDSRAVFLRAKFFFETRPGTVHVVC